MAVAASSVVSESASAVGAQDHAVDECHHVERRAGDLGVVATRDRAGDRHRRVAGEGIEDPPLAVHVVRGGQHRGDRRPSQRPRVAGVVLDAERQVRATRGNETELQRTLDAVDVRAHPRLDAVAVKTGEGLLIETWRHARSR